MKIIEDGKYILRSGVVGGGGTVTTVMVSGNLGGGTLTIGYYDDYSNFIPFVDGVVTGTNTQYVISHGSGVVPFLDVTGSIGAAISIVLTGKG